MAHGETQVPHLSFPFRIGRDGAAAVVEQDTLDEIAQSVQVLMMTRQGERLEVPDYGIADLVFQDDLDLDSVSAAIEEWEPRALARIDDYEDSQDELIRHVYARVTTRD